MLSVRPKITDMHFSLFGRSVHPELVDACGVRIVERENYLIDLRITTDGHLISFMHDGKQLSEVVAAGNHVLPVNGRLISCGVSGNRVNEPFVFEELIGYQSKIELEAVDPKLFVTIQKQLDSKVETEGLLHRFHSNGRVAFGAISYINVQAFINHVKIRSFHTFPDTCAVLKSETVFRTTAT